MTAKTGMSRIELAGGASQHSSTGRLEELGIVGAGGGGFPAAVKFTARVSLVIANAAECEPLLHKDKELLHHYSELFLRGLRMAMELVGAPEGAVGIKEKYHEIIETLERQAPKNVRIVSLPDCYPAGDEFILVHLVTGRVIPPGGLPKDVDAAVSNVETLINIALDRPVTHKYLTVAGAVEHARHAAGSCRHHHRRSDRSRGRSHRERYRRAARRRDDGQTGRQPGRAGDQDHRRHHRAARLAQAHRAPQRPHGFMCNRIGRSACDQCRFCTEFCPRFLLGHPIEPHRAMQSLGFATGADPMVATLYCCECNLCTLYACPEDLDPKNVCVQAKPLARERGLTFKGDPASITPHPLAEFRRVPMRRLIARLGLGEFNNVGPLIEHAFSPRKVKVLAEAARRRFRRFRWSRAATGFARAICSPRRSRASSAPGFTPASTAWSR